ncbi:protein SpAN-like [Panulirus ornatus]|uniref:protein SpAN-like n=1 Tax=Panulirus ornatus TaxID=150431 RepID=UPI003A8C6A74
MIRGFLVFALVCVGVVNACCEAWTTSRAGRAPSRTRKPATLQEMIDRSIAINKVTRIKWPNKTIKVNLENVPKRHKRSIYAVMDDLNSVSCVRYTNSRGSWDIPQVTLVSSPRCSSYVGYQGHPSQLIRLSWRCFKRPGTLAHELLHATGFHHEQERPDRDDYVFVNLTNIQKDRKHNFAKIEGYYGFLMTMGLPYDYDSIMHYPSYSFAKDPSVPTITVKRRHNRPIGQRKALSPSDIARLNRLYNCCDHYLGDDIPGAVPYCYWLKSSYTQPVFKAN